ncbi:MAG: SufE family protein [Flavobacteriales bacterium]|nr:SufE family protein [Flavobacteriales bacterium]
MASIENITEEIVEEFGFFEDWMDKYEHIISLGKSLPPLDEANRKDDFLVKGCQSRVWLVPRFEDGLVYFDADSDAIITKGLVALMVRALSGQTPADIVAANLSFVDQIGLKEHLSPTRSNGLVSMIKQMKMAALAYSAKSI